MEEVEEVEPSRGRGGEAELLMECDEEELEVFPQETEKEVKRETEGGHDRDETTKLAAEGPMEDARINKVPDQPESSRTVEKKLNNTHKGRKKGAPLGFKVNGRLISLQPGGSAAELKLCYHPRGSASGFTKVQVSIHPKVQVSTQPKVQVSTQPKVQVSTQAKVQVSTQPKVQVSTQPKVQVSTQPKVQVSTQPKAQVSTQPKVQVSTHLKVQKPAETDTDTAPAQAGADLTPIITGVVSGEAAQRVLSDNSADIKPPLTEINSQPGSSSLAPQGPTPPNCLVCRSQYKFITKLRGFMCLCSPVIALSLKNLKKKKRRSSHRRSRDKNRISTSYRESHTVRPPGTLSRPGPSPQDQDQYRVSQSKLVILVEDFYYGSAPGQRKVNKEAQSWNRGPYHSTHCQIPMQNNIELMNHMKLHITRPRVDRRRDSLTFCPHCFRHFPSPVSLQRHLEAVHSQCKSTALCKICELAFSSEVTFLSHMKNTHKPGEMPYTCQVCDFRSSFYADVWSHFELTHADSEHLLCPFCLRVMSSSTCYQQHVTRHQRKHVFGCDRCRLHFLYDKERIQHKLIHHRTHVKPVQLTGLKPGTKVTVRTYAEAPKKTSSSKGVDLESPPIRRGALKRTPVESLGRVLSTLSQESMSNSVSRPSPLCVECMSPIQDFKTHFPSVVRCSVCSFLTCCCTAYANHMIRNHAVQTTAPQYANIFQSQPRLSEKLDCLLCMFSTYSGDMMANHLTERPQHGCAMLPNDRTTSNESHDELFAPLGDGEESEEFWETSDLDMNPEMEPDEQNVDIKEEAPCDPAYGRCSDEVGEMMQMPNHIPTDEDEKPFINVSQQNLQGQDFDGSSMHPFYHLIDERGQSHDVSNTVLVKPEDIKEEEEEPPIKRVKISYTPLLMPPAEPTGVKDLPNNPVRLSQIHQHIESFYPTMSHYGRNYDHDQRFLPSDVSLRLMFEDFAARHRTSFKRYQKALTSCNVSFSRPGEEPCDLCLQHQHHMSIRHRNHDWVKNLQEAPPDCSTCSLWEEHRDRMEKATRYYKRDARKPQSDELSIRRVDLQRVILLPRMPGVKHALSSKRISAFHETFATISQKRGSEKKSISVIWHEGVALRKAVEVASAFVCGLQREWNVPHIVVWLDGSTAQYRNWCLVTTLITLVNQTWNRNEDLTLKYFEPGHTFITTDCFHQRVEREMERRPEGKVLDFQDFRKVVAAAQWGDVDVMELQNEDIRVWKEGNSRRKLTNTPPLPELAQIQFRKGSRLLWVKLSHDQEEFTPVDFLRNRTRLNIPERLRPVEQGIGRRKKLEILVNLARMMPPQSRHFWESLAESAVDDEDDEDDEDDDDEDEEDEEEGEDE